MDETTLAELFSLLSDEEKAQLLGVSNVPNRNALLAQELEAAQGFGAKRSGPALTPLGGALGGASDAIRDVASMYQQKKLMGQMQGNLGKLEDPKAASLAMGLPSEEATRRKLLAQMLQTGGAGDAFMPPGLV